MSDWRMEKYGHRIDETAKVYVNFDPHTGQWVIDPLFDNDYPLDTSGDPVDADCVCGRGSGEHDRVLEQARAAKFPTLRELYEILQRHYGEQRH